MVVWPHGRPRRPRCYGRAPCHARGRSAPGRVERDDLPRHVTFLIAELSGEPVGYAKLHAGAPDASVTGPKPIELVRLYVLPESIGHGIGARLMKECVDTATGRGLETLWLGVWEHNPRAIRFYQKWGFEEVGSHVFQLGSDAQTDLIMQKSLTDDASGTPA